MSGYGGDTYGLGVYGGMGGGAGSPPGGGAPSDAFPGIIIEIAFADGPLVAAPVWTDVSAWARYASPAPSSRSDELGRFNSGTMTVRLNNSDRRFDPTNTSSPYSPNVLPMRQIRARALWDGVYYPLFRGFIERWAPTLVGSSNAEVTLECTDAFAWLANVTVVDPLYAEDTAGQRIIDLLTDIGWDPTMMSVRTTTNQALVVEIDETDTELNVLDAMQQAADSELGDLYVDAAGVIVMRDRRQKLEAISAAPVATFGDDIASGELPYTGLAPSYDIAQVFNHAVVTLPDWDPSEYEDTASQATYGKRTQTHDTILLDPIEADAIANLIVWRHKDARLRFDSMNVRPVSSIAGLWEAVLGANVATVWVIKWRPPGGGPTITQTVIVNGVSHDIGPGQRWGGSQFGVASPDPVTTYFTIEDPVLGVIEGPGVIAY